MQIRREFSDDAIYAWFKADPEADDYTVPVSGQRGALRASVTGLAGMLSVPTDGITLNCLAANFPFPPVSDTTFLVGPAASPAQSPPVPADDLPVYRILTVSGAEVLTHIHITAERQA